jgi:hypothetical protein
MKSIERRLDVLEAMSEEELDARIQALASGQSVLDDLPEPNLSCPRCQKAAAMSEEELDAKLARLIGILQAAERYESR